MEGPIVFSLNFVALSGIAIATSSLFMAALMFAVGQTPLNRIWGIFCFAVFIWGLSFFFIATTNDAAQAKLWWHISHIGVIAIPTLFIHFVYSFLKKDNAIVLLTFYITSSVFLAANLFTDLLITDVRFVFDSFYYDSPPGILYLPFILFFHLAIGYGHWLLWRGYTYIYANDEEYRERIRYFFMATVVGFLGGSVSFAPVFAIDIYPYTIVTVTLYPIIMGYAILKYRLFDIRIVSAQLTMLAIVGFTFVRFLLSQTITDYVGNGILLVITIGLGIHLVRNVMKEIETREHIEKLANDLKKANKRLKELDKMKSEFVSIASHQLRSPLTAIRGYTSMLLEGSFGKLPKKAQDAVEKIDESGKFMALSVEDYLNVSRIQSGNMKYEMEEFNLKKVAKEIVDTFRQEATKKGLVLSCRFDVDSDCIVKADHGKTRQIIQNLIDNAIKYTKKGSVTVHIRDTKRPKRIYVDVVDTGIGMSEETIDNLFEKFERAKNANEVNVTGTGLGLFVAHKMAEGMGGTVSAESDGEGEGSTFTLELPRTS